MEKTIPNKQLLHKKEAVMQRRMQELGTQLGCLVIHNYEYRELRDNLQKVQAELYAPRTKSQLKQALQEKIAQFESHRKDERYQTRIEQNAVVVTLRELKYLDSIAEYEECDPS